MRMWMTAARGLLLLTGLSAGACERHVTVFDAAGGSPAVGQGGADSGGPGPVIEPWQPTGGSTTAGGGWPATGGGTGDGATGGLLSGGAMPTGGTTAPEELAGVDQAAPGAQGPLAEFRVLARGVRLLVRPAVNAAGVSLMTESAGDAAVLYVPFDGEPQVRHAGQGTSDIYTAAGGPHHVALLRGSTYRVFIDGEEPELSRNEAVYKEFLAASAYGCAWLDYGRDAGGASALGHIVYRPYGAAPLNLTDGTRYRAELALSDTHLAFVEYPSVDKGALGQVVVVPLGGGPAVIASSSANHQAAPALSGDWVVWEEYVGDEHVVMRARNLRDGRVFDLSPGPGYRTRPDVHGDRVVWEDYSAGNGEIHLFDLGTGESYPIVTGVGRSLAPRLTADGLVWLEQLEGQTALLHARFTSP